MLAFAKFQMGNKENERAKNWVNLRAIGGSS